MSAPTDALRLAVGTLTVLPVRPPRAVDHPVGALAMALAPVAVLPLAVTAGAATWLGDAASAPTLLTGALVVAVLALGSGGLHLDGLADTADGLTVPGDRSRRLQVMRSGDVGPVGAATLVLVLLVQASALSGVVAGLDELDGAVATGLAVLVSRGVLALACMRGVGAARDDGLGYAVAGSVPVPVAVVVLVGLAVLAGAIHGRTGVAGVMVAAVATGVVLLRARRRLGGVTGDVLGACVEVALAGYLVVLTLNP